MMRTRVSNRVAAPTYPTQAAPWSWDIISSRAACPTSTQDGEKSSRYAA